MTILRASVHVKPIPLPPDLVTPPVARLIEYLRQNRIEAELIAPGVPTPTVPAAAAALGVDESCILKTMLFVERTGSLVIAIAAGPDRIERDLLTEASSLTQLKLADAETVMRVTGYPAGGVAPVAHLGPTPVLIDRRAANLDIAFGGGGSDALMLQIHPSDIMRLTNAHVVDLVKAKTC